MKLPQFIGRSKTRSTAAADQIEKTLGAKSARMASDKEAQKSNHESASESANESGSNPKRKVVAKKTSVAKTKSIFSKKQSPKRGRSSAANRKPKKTSSATRRSTKNSVAAGSTAKASNQSIFSKASDKAAKTADRSSIREAIRSFELIIFALIAPVIGLLLFSHDPFGLHSGFPWVAVGPVIFAARYGSSWGMSCALLAGLAILYPMDVYAGELTMIVSLGVGTIVLSLVVGDSSTAWRKRTGQAEAENQYLRHRLTEFSKDYHVLKVSHGQLEEFMAGQRLSLRQALQQLKPVLTSNENGMEAGSELMAIFSQFCSVQVAGLYAMKTETLVDQKAIAIHGNMDDLQVFDPLLNLAIKERKLVSIRLESLATDNHDSGLLAVVPIADSNNKLHGVLAIRDMHFMAFQQENLNLLSLLGGYVGDMLTRSKGLSGSRTGWFLAELDTSLQFARRSSVQSSLLCIKLRRFGEEDEIAQFISTSIRSLDASWLPKTDDETRVIVILLPLISSTQCQAYVKRITTTILQKFQLDMDKIVSTTDSMQITKSDSRESILEFIQQISGSQDSVIDEGSNSRRVVGESGGSNNAT